MKHPHEEELIAYRDGEIAGDVARDELGQRAMIAAHVKECPECKAELERIDAVLVALDTMPIPDPGEDYAQRVWKQIAPRLPEKRRRLWGFRITKQTEGGASSWANWFQPRRLAAFSAIAALVVLAFVAGRWTTPRGGPAPMTADAGKVRERVLVMAVGEHLGRSEMVLVELANAGPTGGEGPKQVDISAEQRRAEDLLEENRLYRQTALEQGDAALASVLDELERVLLDVAHSPQEVSAAQLETIRRRIESRGILFKVRVVGKELQQRGESAQPSRGENGSAGNERNKT